MKAMQQMVINGYLQGMEMDDNREEFHPFPFWLSSGINKY